MNPHSVLNKAWRQGISETTPLRYHCATTAFQQLAGFEPATQESHVVPQAFATTNEKATTRDGESEEQKTRLRRCQGG